MVDDVPDKLLRDLGRAPIIPEADIDIYVRAHGSLYLTEEETRVLQAASVGLSAKMSAVAFGKSVGTIKTQLKTARYKLRAKSTVHAVALAIRQGLI